MRAEPETLSSVELVEAALDCDEDTRWEYIRILHQRGSEEEFALALPLTTSGDKARRMLGADILAQLGSPEPTFVQASVAQLIVMLDDPEPEVLYSVATALGHRGDPSAISHLVELKNHDSEQVRYGVAFGISCHENELAIATLVELTNDANEMVRDWATFALGSQSASDSDAIRAALLARLNDADENIRAEAIVGLARRGYEESAKLVLKELGRGIISSLLLEAAEMIGDPVLYPPLRLLSNDLASVEDFDLREALDDALEACEPKGT